MCKCILSKLLKFFWRNTETTLGRFTAAIERIQSPGEAAYIFLYFTLTDVMFLSQLLYSRLVLLLTAVLACFPELTQLGVIELHEFGGSFF